jgi:putative ABC transport system permease protein
MLLRDIRHAIVLLCRDRRFAATAVITLALGIGATTAVFSVVYGVLLRPLPYPESDRLVQIFEEHPGAPRPPGEPSLSNTTMYAWQARLRTLEGLAAYYAREFTATFGGEPVRVHGAEASPALFPLLRARAQLGRFYLPGEDAPRANHFVVIGDRLWREQFAARTDVVGRSIALDGELYTIVGVASAGLTFPDASTALWVPYADPTLVDWSVQGGMWLAPTLGRLKPEVTIAAAAAEGTTAARSVQRPPVAALLFGAGGPVEVRVERLVDRLTSGVRPALLLLAASVALVLLIGCANAANLFLSRGISRQRELAVRIALGARVVDVARQLFIESLLVAAAGGAAGLAVAAALMGLLPALAPADFPRLDGIHLDPMTAVFAAAVSIVVAILAGLVPAIRASRAAAAASLRSGDRAAGSDGTQASGLRDALVVIESALATLLIIGAALLGRSVAALLHVDPGYDAANVLVAQVFPAPGSTGEQRTRFANRLVERLRSDPQVVAAGAGNMMPFNDSTWIAGFTLPPSAGGGKPTSVRTLRYVVTPGYAEALRLRLVEGRLLTDDDAEPPSTLKVLVNREFVRAHLTAGPIAGRRFAGGPNKAAEFEIVGVVGDVLKDGLDARPQPEIYSVATDARPIDDEANVVMRMAGDPARGAAILRAAVRETDPRAAIGLLTPLSSRVAASAAQPRFAVAVLGGFAALALALASVGVYGVLSYVVARRKREIGVRAALGARRADLIAMVVREGLSRAAVGTLIGIGAAALLTRLMRALLFGVGPLDAFAYVAAPAILIPVALLACVAPALRAAATDPATILRE